MKNILSVIFGGVLLCALNAYGSTDQEYDASKSEKIKHLCEKCRKLEGDNPAFNYVKKEDARKRNQKLLEEILGDQSKRRTSVFDSQSFMGELMNPEENSRKKRLREQEKKIAACELELVKGENRVKKMRLLLDHSYSSKGVKNITGQERVEFHKLIERVRKSRKSIADSLLDLD